MPELRGATLRRSPGHPRRPSQQAPASSSGHPADPAGDTVAGDGDAAANIVTIATGDDPTAVAGRLAITRGPTPPLRAPRWLAGSETGPRPRLAQKLLRVGAARWLCSGHCSERLAWLGHYDRVLRTQARCADLPPPATTCGQTGRGAPRAPKKTPRDAGPRADEVAASHRAADGAGPSIEGARTCAHGTSRGAAAVLRACCPRSSCLSRSTSPNQHFQSGFSTRRNRIVFQPLRSYSNRCRSKGRY